MSNNREHPAEQRFKKKFRKFTTPILIIVIGVIILGYVTKSNMQLVTFYLVIFLTPLIYGAFVGSLYVRSQIEEILPYMNRSFGDYLDAKNKMHNEWDEFYKQSGKK